MKKFVFAFVFLFFLQIVSVAAANEPKSLVKKNSDLVLAPFEDFLFAARVDFLLTKMEDIMISSEEVTKDLLFFEKTGAFLAEKYSLLNHSQRSRLFKCVLI